MEKDSSIIGIKDAELLERTDVFFPLYLNECWVLSGKPIKK